MLLLTSLVYGPRRVHHIIGDHRDIDVQCVVIALFDSVNLGSQLGH